MIVEIHLPRLSEADYEYNQKDGIITLTPLFSKPDASQAILHMQVRGDSGRIVGAVVSIVGSTGRVIASSTRTKKNGKAAFDGLGADDDEPAETGKDGSNDPPTEPGTTGGKA